MKRRLLTIAIFLLAGAVVNVAVAWAITAGTKLPGWPPTPTTAEDEWPYPVPSHWPERAMTIQGGTFGWRFDQYQGHAAEEREDGELWATEQFVINIASTGWPCHALQYETWIDYVLPQEPEVIGHYRFDGQTRLAWWLGGIGLPTKRFGFGPPSYKRLPLHPLWPGFAVNTFFYATILWLLIPGSFALRRFVRARRGLCAACGYDLRHGEHEACPECGVTA